MKHTISPRLSPPLASAIEDCYEAFSHYRTPAELDVCTYCCMAPEVEEQMRRLPLRQLTRQHFFEYNFSAKSQVQDAAEVGYFLPRMLELIAEGEEVHHSIELYLVRLGGCSKDSFSSAQWQAVQVVAQVMLADCLRRFPWERGGPWNGETVFDVVLMFHIGGLGIRPLLGEWQRTDTPQATLHYANAAWFDYWRKGCIDNPFADGELGYHQRMSDWLGDQGHRIAFARRLLALDLSRIPGVDQWCCGDRYTPETLIQCLTNAMTQGLSDQALREVLKH